MPISDIANRTVSLPLVGTVSLIAALGIGAVLFFALRRKKSISLKI